MAWLTEATPQAGVEDGAGWLPAPIADLAPTPAEDLVPGRPPARPFPGGAFVEEHAGRYEVLELPDGWTVVDLEAEQTVDPRRPWSQADAELVAGVLAERPGYALQLRWRSAR